MGEAALKYNYSIKEYLEMEANSLGKLEYHEGEVFAMAGGTLNHSLLSNNVGGSLRQAIKTIGKLEYHEGEVFAMAGGTLNHSLLSNNVGGSLRQAIKTKGKSCRTYNSDAKIAISEEKFVYSDTFVVCGKTETFPEMPQAVKNPILIVEVLSDSTALYDRQGKFQAYHQYF